MEDEAGSILAALASDDDAALKVSGPYSFYLISDYRVVKWTDHHFVPSVTAIQGEYSTKLLKDGNSDYLAKKWKMGDNRALVGVITLVKKYQIINNYLRPQWNERIFPFSNIMVLDAGANLGVPVCIEKECAFRIDFSSSGSPIHNTGRIIGSTALLIALLLLVILCNHLLKKTLTPDYAFLLLLLLLVVLRQAMTYAEFPSRFVGGDLFNPLVFASSSINASLGDLLINEIALFVLCIFIFRNLTLFKSIHYLQQSSTGSWILDVAASILFLFSILYPFVVIQTLYNNSAISLSMTESLRMDGLRIAAFAIVLIAGICTFLFSHALLRILARDSNVTRVIVSLFIGSVIFFGVNYFSGQHFFSSLVIGVTYFLTMYLLRLSDSLPRISFTTFTYLFVCVFFISINSAYSVGLFSRNEKIGTQFRFARDFLINRDNFAEYLLQELSHRISGDAFIQSRIATPFLGKDAVKHKVRQIFLPSYFNKYDVEIFIFNAAGEGNENRVPISFSELLADYDSDANRTDYEGIYFVNSPSGDVTQKYLVVVPVHWMKSVAGHVVLELSLKKVIPENVYPELLVDNRFQKFYRSEELSYGLFLNNRLSYSSGDYNYEGAFSIDWFGFPELHTKGMTINGYDHIAVEDELGRIAVVSSVAIPFSFHIANFSFFIVIGLIAILLFIFIQGIISYIRGVKLYFAARIQLFLNLAFFLPLIIVSIMTLSVTSRSSKNQLNEEYLEKTRRFAEVVSAELHKNLIGMEPSIENFESDFSDLATLTDLDANVYNASGYLITSSQPLIFENKLLSHYINSQALSDIRRGENVLIKTQRVGMLEYSTVYAPLRAPTSGALIGIVSVPFFQSLYSGEQVQITILANILNIFAIIFIGLVVLSYLVTRWLTFPLSFITQSLRKTSLTKTNQPLVWKADDEIGLMVKEYNQMLFKLSESKAELEQTQRERAWREIAQQVAHEIKNPLTPMKLTLQQLERLLLAGKAAPEKVEKSVASLLTQVDTLNEIASSFSSFAKMPEPVIKPLEIVSLLRRIVDLHSHSGDLRFENKWKELVVMGDEQLLARTFSNIILNAFQAARPGVAPVVWIEISKRDDRAILSFRDNGRGIDSITAESMFVPHFTTKKSGSGLGLAIAKQAIEHMSGKIWFETEPGKGTTFFIDLPLFTDQG